MGTAILEIGWQVLDSIIKANSLSNIEKFPEINCASIAFDQLKTKLRMAFELKLISPKRYAFLIIQNEEIGKMLSGWLKWAKART